MGTLNRLTARRVETIKKPGSYADGGGLYIHVSKGKDRKSGNPTHHCRWEFRYTRNGKSRSMGLGSALTVKLTIARKKAAQARDWLNNNLDPIEMRDAAKRPVTATPSFGEVAEELHRNKSTKMRNAKAKKQWLDLLYLHTAAIWSLPVDKVDTEAVLFVLKAIPRPETASRTRGKIEQVLDAAKAHGHRHGENPATWRGHLKHLLPERPEDDKSHHAAMSYVEVPAFVAILREHETVPALALEFLILTAARAGEAIGAHWFEIDLDARLWTIPAARMKAGKEHRVPLSDRAMAIIRRMSEFRVSDFVFPGHRRGKPLSDGALMFVLRSMKVEDSTVHGFRSAFRDWCGNETHTPREIAEQALAHAAGDSTERAYRRGDALEKRRGLMKMWSDNIENRGRGNVIAFTGG